MEDDHFDSTTKLAKRPHWSLLVTPEIDGRGDHLSYKMYIHTTTTTTTHGMDHGLVSSRIFFGHQKITTLLRGYQECSWKF